ncbi:asparaginase [Cryobacterium ruanii]|uniref:asparaginase n=1 Tax=Cryobacterium ruanii TaxID=1259197 RepID=UPI0018E06601|nr:asparaginase [Cryobacterium ruanii]
MNLALPRIALFTLGGTIASLPTKGGEEAIPTLTADLLIKAVPQLEGLARLEATTFCQTASGDLTIETIQSLASAIESCFVDGVDGVVVTQGTDTLEETAYLLDLLTSQEKPIVLTGAMRNAGLAGADGPANLLAAVQVASSKEAHNVGPLVVFADLIHLPRFVRKSHSGSIAAFTSPNAGPIGWITEGKVRIPLAPKKRTHPFIKSATGSPIPRVALVKVGFGDDLEILKDLDQRGYQGLVVEAFGGGHLPSGDVEHVSQLASRIPVLFTSRTGAGEVFTATYGFAGSEKDLLDRNLIGAGIFDGLKARLLLILLLRDGATRAQIIERFS